MQLQNAKAKFEQQGIRLAAISYDSQAILIDFAKRHNIEFPLLADPDSKVIRSFDILNSEARASKLPTSGSHFRNLITQSYPAAG